MSLKTLQIIDIGCNGEGIAKDDKKVVFVPFTLFGEKIKAEITQEKSKYSKAKPIEIIEKSPHRQIAPCPYFSLCGGCDLQHCTMHEQVKLKTKIVHDSLQKIAKIDFPVSNCISSEKEFGYRNKMTFPINNTLGMFESNSNQIVEIKNCMLEENSQIILEIFNNYLKKCKEIIEIFKYLQYRVIDNNFLFTLVITQNKLPQKEYLVSLLKSKFQEHFGLYTNINNSKNEILSDKFSHIAGFRTLKSENNGIKFEIGPYSFMQVNTYVQDMIYHFIADNAGENVIDAYSGAGLLSAYLSKKAKQVYAIEINKEASKMANEIINLNKIVNLQNYNGDCKSILPKLANKIKNFTLVLDPPRSGCDKEILQTINKSKPQKIFYISCEIATLARDLKELIGYKIQSIQPYDMFPQTRHVETVVLMSRVI